MSHRFALLLIGICTVSAFGATQGELLQRALEDSIQMRKAQDAFAATHPYEGKYADVFARELRRDGFACRLQNYPQVHAGRGEDLGKFFPYQLPGVHCIHESLMKDRCGKFRASIIPDWSEVPSSLQAAAADLGKTKIKSVYFVCDSLPLSDNERRAIERDLADGNLIEVR
jgi:hypothetical protein